MTTTDLPADEARERGIGSEPVLEVRGLQKYFPIRGKGLLRRTVGYIKAVDGISLTVRAGQTVGVVGESGSGKTTLGLAMLRLVPSQGDIDFAGQPLQGLSWRELRPLRREMQIGRASCRERVSKQV